MTKLRRSLQLTLISAHKTDLRQWRTYTYIYFPSFQRLDCKTVRILGYSSPREQSNQRGPATAFDLAAFRLSMIAPVKKSVNHSRTVASMRETGWEQQQQHQGVRLRSDSTVWSEFAFGPVGHCLLCCNQLLSAVMWSLRFPVFWFCVCHCGLLR